MADKRGNRKGSEEVITSGDRDRSPFGSVAHTDTPKCVGTRTDGRFGNVSQGDLQGVARVVDAAARKGVELDIRALGGLARSVAEAAAVIGSDLDHVVAPVVFVAVHPDGRLVPIVCLASARSAVDAGLLAAVVGETVIRRATPAEISHLTGFPAEGIPPFGFGRGVRVVMDQELGSCEWLWALAGSDSAMLRVSPGVLRMLANAFVTPLAAAPWEAAAVAGASVGALDSRRVVGARSQA
jgi:prolyl-tRNA editing enzyme YbaK/EbsC (Cys-tRNA(Pro) deacylase)